LLDSLLQEIEWYCGMKTYSDYIVDYDKYGGFDVVLVCQNQLFHTHRLLLSAGSSFLSAILKSCGFEDDVVTILLPDFEPAQVLVGRGWSGSPALQ